MMHQRSSKAAKLDFPFPLLIESANKEISGLLSFSIKYFLMSDQVEWRIKFHVVIYKKTVGNTVSQYGQNRL